MRIFLVLALALIYSCESVPTIKAQVQEMPRAGKEFVNNLVKFENFNESTRELTYNGVKYRSDYKTCWVEKYQNQVDFFSDEKIMFKSNEVIEIDDMFQRFTTYVYFDKNNKAILQVNVIVKFTLSSNVLASTVVLEDLKIHKSYVFRK